MNKIITCGHSLNERTHKSSDRILIWQSLANQSWYKPYVSITYKSKHLKAINVFICRPVRCYMTKSYLKNSYVNYRSTVEDLIFKFNYNIHWVNINKVFTTIYKTDPGNIKQITVSCSRLILVRTVDLSVVVLPFSSTEATFILKINAVFWKTQIRKDILIVSKEIHTY